MNTPTANSDKPTRRESVCRAIESLLNSISVEQGYNTDFEQVNYWQDVDTEYGFNHITFKDVFCDYERHNQLYTHNLDIKISAIVYGENPAEIGSKALGDIINVIQINETLNGLSAYIILDNSKKEVATAGLSRCLIELNLTVSYRLPIYLN